MFETIKGIIGDIAAGAIKDQRIALSQEQLTVLDAKLHDALSECDVLRQRVSELEQLSADREAQLQQLTEAQQRHDDRPEAEQRILLLLMAGSDGNRGQTIQQIAQQFQVGEQVVRLHLVDLKQADLIWPQNFLNRESEWHLSHEGRRYLAARGLLR